MITRTLIYSQNQPIQTLEKECYENFCTIQEQTQI